MEYSMIDLMHVVVLGPEALEKENSRTDLLTLGFDAIE